MRLSRNQRVTFWVFCVDSRNSCLFVRFCLANCHDLARRPILARKIFRCCSTSQSSGAAVPSMMVHGRYPFERNVVKECNLLDTRRFGASKAIFDIRSMQGDQALATAQHKVPRLLSPQYRTTTARELLKRSSPLRRAALEALFVFKPSSHIYS